MVRMLTILSLLFVTIGCLGCAEEKKVTFPDKISSPPGTASQQQEKTEASP
ncbi:hypothetical protein [Lacipirellula parvula]|uniref:Uncharacterized protein n=1 Tax=Lacipirellula parvula TaxID=2650471 RepID=A0A5K7XFE7_9BACT|nr:hypothetical protein [Lacipirellula parvula]BBO33601.1 hypothetical protein PLANPX_3213 [Lacipirellula parvula]